MRNPAILGTTETQRTQRKAAIKSVVCGLPLCPLCLRGSYRILNSFTPSGWWVSRTVSERVSGIWLVPNHPVRSFSGGFAIFFLMSRPPLLREEGSGATRKFGCGPAALCLFVAVLLRESASIPVGFVSTLSPSL